MGYTLSFQEMLAQDIEMEARKKRLIDEGDNIVASGNSVHKDINPNFLGTTLRKRFSESRLVRKVRN